MPKFDKEPEQEAYAVNKTTLLSFLGLLLFGFTGIVFMFNAAGRLVASIWMYTQAGSSPGRAGVEFFIATFCFIIAMFCQKATAYCLSQLRKHKLPY